MSEAFRRIAKSESSADAAAVLEGILDFHQLRPGVTEATLGTGLTLDGRSSYQVLAQAVPSTAKIVIDLACGNGPLTELILLHRPELSQIIGIDLSPVDLELARKRVTDSRAEFRCENVNSIGLADQLADAVVCHLALFLFNPVNQAVREIARVLKPGGIFAAVVQSFDENRCPLFDSALGMLPDAIMKDNSQFKGFHLGDPKATTLEGLQALFADPGDWDTRFRRDEFTLLFRDTPKQLAQKLPDFLYPTALLSPAGLRHLQTEWQMLFEKSCAADGLVEFPFPLSIIQIGKRA